MSNNILPQSDFRSYLFSSSQQQIHFPVSSPSARSSFVVSSSFQGSNSGQNNQLQSYQTPPRSHHRSSLFDPRAQLKAAKDNSQEMNFFSTNQKFKSDLQNDLSNILNNSNFSRPDETSKIRIGINSSKQQSTPAGQPINPQFLSDREIVAPYGSSNKIISIFSKKLNSSKSDLPMLQEQNEEEIHQISQSNQQNQQQFHQINQQKQLTYLRDKHQKRSVSLDPISHDDILKDWLIGSTPQNIEPVTPIKILERRRRRVSPAIVNQPALVEESPKVERLIPSNFKAEMGVLNASNRRLSKRDIKIDDSFSSQMNQFSLSQQNSQNLIQLNQHQPYAEDKSPISNGSPSPLHSSLMLKKILGHTQTQRLSVTDMINSTKSPFGLRKRQKALTNLEDYENQAQQNVPLIRITKEPVEGCANDDEDGGDISNRYMPSSMDQGVSRYAISTPSPINARTSKGFMNLFRNNNNSNNENVAISNQTNNINSAAPLAPRQLNNSQSANTLQQHQSISNSTEESQYFQNPQQTTTRRQHIIRPQRRNLTDSSISYFENSVLKVEPSRLKGILKNKGDDFLKPRNESVNFSEMETLDDTSNRFNQSTRLGLSSMYSNGLSFQKEHDQGDYYNSESSSGFRKGSIKPSKKVIFQERVSIFDIATKFKAISTLTKLQNRKL